MKCADHIKDDHKKALGYTWWHHEARLSYAKGERQTQCDGCKRWFFLWERTVAPLPKSP